MKLFSLLALTLAVAHGGAAAQDIPERTWSTSAELGAITTTGNTVGTSVTGKIDARQELDNWSNEYILSGYFKEDETHTESGEKLRERSAERFALSAKAAYKLLDDNKKLFVLGSHVNDKFGAYTTYSSLSVGHSSRWYKSRDKTLDVELGPGYFAGTRATGESENGMTVRGAASMRWQVSPSALFTQTVSMERGTSNLHSQAETALSTKINGTMQMKAAFSARSDSNVPEDKKNTDTQTSLTLVYSF
jgi:putative salt-induced outer membrane protein YdiY